MHVEAIRDRLKLLYAAHCSVMCPSSNDNTTFRSDSHHYAGSWWAGGLVLMMQEQV